MMRRIAHQHGRHGRCGTVTTGEHASTAGEHTPAENSGDTDAGVATLEIAVLMSAVLLIVFALIQGAFWYHARTVALGAAEEAVRAERYDRSGGGGAQVALDFINRVSGDSVLLAPGVNVQRSPLQVSVTVTGRSMQIVPGLNIEVSQTAAGPVERFTSS